MYPLALQIVTSAVGNFLGNRFFGAPACTCVCDSGGGIDVRVLEIRGQLDRCGPERLAGPAVACGTAWVSIVFAFIVGLICGFFIAALLLLRASAPAREPRPRRWRPSLTVAVRSPLRLKRADVGRVLPHA